MLCPILFAAAFSALAGTPEKHPAISWSRCTKAGCTKQNGGIVIDSEWREIVEPTSGKSCLKGEQWDNSVCSGAADCGSKCALNGFEYSKASVSTSGSAVRLGFVNPDGSIGSRVYLYDEDKGKYVIFSVLNKEFTFDCDTSTLPCGTNGALYYSEMDADGGMGRFPANKAGAKYGTGYCDAQCPKDGKFIGNNANVGRVYGSCCAEFDIWEANKYATQIASHPCSMTVSGPSQVCQGTCRECDTSGCAWNHYRGDKEYFGPGLKVDTTKKFTCVTQFVTDTGSDLGNLKEVRRLYVQGGKVIQNNVVKVEDWGSGKQVWHNYDSLTTEWCDKLSWDSDYENRGGHASMGRSLRRGHVLAMSLWTDGDMWWLDSGNDHGPCKAGPGKAALVRDNPRAYVEYSNIKFGDIGSTY